MKIIKILLVTPLFIVCSCTLNKLNQESFNDKTYQSSHGPLFIGNKITFNADKTFVYIGHGPSVFLSKGNWECDRSVNEIILHSRQPEERFLQPKSVDTLWINISNSKVKVVAKNKIIFENTTYYLQ